MSASKFPDYIHFAIPFNATCESREGARERVASRFDGLSTTTELVGVRDFGRLYRMERAPKR